MNKVVSVTANVDLSLDLKFENGSSKRFDVRPYLDYEFFTELKNPDYFKEVSVAFGTVQWPHGQDISPDTLFLEGVSLPLPTTSDQRNVA